MRLFLICLSPAILGFILILVGVAGSNASGDFIAGAIYLFGFGALVSGGCVARNILRGEIEPSWWRWTAAVLAFIAVAAGYFAMTMGGCCGLVMMTESY